MLARTAKQTLAWQTMAETHVDSSCACLGDRLCVEGGAWILSACFCGSAVSVQPLHITRMDVLSARVLHVLIPLGPEPSRG